MSDQTFPIEPPVPHNDILDTLRPVFAQLRAAAARSPGDAHLLAAVAHVAGAVAALELASPTRSRA